MKTNKLLLAVLAGIAIVFASCSAASISSGTYSGTYNAYGFPTSGGNGTAVITLVNDNTVNVKITSSGNPDIIMDGVTVTKFEAYGVTQITFSGSNSSLSIGGDYTQVAGVNSCSINIDSVASSSYIYFDGTK